MSETLSPRIAVALFAVAIFSWGINWSVTQVVVSALPPLWWTSIRCWIAAAALLPMLLFSGKLILPPRGDYKVVLSVALLHLTAFSTLAAASQKFLPASKAIVLGYSTPLWVAIAAPFVLGEKITGWRATGIAISLCGLAVIFNPVSFDWTDLHTMTGCGLVILASICWATNIILLRSHKWIASPFQLLFWQVLVAAIVLTTAALIVNGVPDIHWSGKLIALMMQGGLVGTVLAYWAMSMVNRALPAITTSLGVLMTPLVGMACASLLLGESVSLSLVLAALLIVGGVALGTVVDAIRSKTSHR
jgi:drug/metabolite transporter (DMT)-like permease